MGKIVLVPEFTENCQGLLEGLFKISNNIFLYQHFPRATVGKRVLPITPE